MILKVKLILLPDFINDVLNIHKMHLHKNYKNKILTRKAISKLGMNIFCSSILILSETIKLSYINMYSWYKIHNT